MAQVTFYGAFSGWGSYPTVCRALARHMRVAGVSLLCVNLRSEEPEGCDDLEVLPFAPEATPVGLLFDFPGSLLRCLKHQRMIGYHVCDGDAIPPAWVQLMNQEALVLTPSAWCASVFRRCGVTKPIEVVPHGVNAAFYDARGNRPPGKPPRLLHFCSGHPARKGTLELLAALSLVEEPLHLTLRVSDECRAELRKTTLLANLEGRGVLEGESPTPPEGMARLFANADLLVHPSRGEGFGMIPLEARAAGLPVITTSCTALASHEGADVPGTMHVRVGPFAPLYGAGSVRAPHLDPKVLAGVLGAALRRLGMLQREARDNAAATYLQWEWPTVLERSGFLEHLALV